MRHVVFHPLAPLILFSIALSALLSGYFTAGYAPSQRFELLAAFFWAILLALWVVADARRRMGIPCFDFGFFCYVFLPIAVPRYCFWSRGWRGGITLALIAGLWLTPYIVASVAWIFLFG